MRSPTPSWAPRRWATSAATFPTPIRSGRARRASSCCARAARWSATPASTSSTSTSPSCSSGRRSRRTSTRCARGWPRARHRRRRGQHQGQDQRRRRRRRPRRGDRRPRRRAAAATTRPAVGDRRRRGAALHESTVRSEPHRSAARRQRPHRAVQLAAGARQRRHVRAAHRGHRCRALDARVRGRHPRGSALAGPGLGRRARRRRRARAVSPVGAAAPLCVVRQRAASPAGTPTTASVRREQLEGDRREALAAGRPPQYAGTCRRHAAGRGARADRAGERPAIRFRVPEHVEVAFQDVVRGEVGVQHRRHRRPGASCGRTAAGLQLRGRRRRCADGDHACDSRRGSHLEHAAADPALRGARLHAAGVRASRAGDGARPHAAVEAARRDVGRRVPRARAICPRRW